MPIARDEARPDDETAAQPLGSAADEFAPARIAALRLALTPGVGPLTARRLLDRFGTAEAVFAAPASQWYDVPGTAN